MDRDRLVGSPTNQIKDLCDHVRRIDLLAVVVGRRAGVVIAAKHQRGKVELGETLADAAPVIVELLRGGELNFEIIQA